MSDELNVKTINTNTGIGISVLALLIGGVLWINNTVRDSSIANAAAISELKLLTVTQNSKIAADMETLKGQMLSMQDNAWTQPDAFQWSVQLQRANPTLNVPDPKKTK